MSSARPSRHHHGIRYASADHDRLKRALLQPVQAWEKKWQYPVSGGKNFMLYKWVKCNRKMTFDEEDDEDEENQQHHQAEDTPTPTAFSLAPPTEASTPLPSESDENRLLRPPPHLTSAKSTSSLRGSSVPSAVSTPLIGVNTPQEAESSAVDSPDNDEDEEMAVDESSSTDVIERKEGVISSNTSHIGDVKIEGVGIVSEGSTEKIGKVDSKDKQDEIKQGEDEVNVGGIDNINIGGIDNINIGGIDSINIGGIDNIDIDVIDNTNISSIDNTNISNPNISSIGNPSISGIDNINIGSIDNADISNIDNINISSNDNLGGNIDSVDNISMAVNMDIFGGGQETGGEKEDASRVGGLKVGDFWNPAGESTAQSSEIGEQNSPYRDVG
ncbi:5390_t:CDS:2, partial [Paraglomus occultum]